MYFSREYLISGYEFVYTLQARNKKKNRIYKSACLVIIWDSTPICKLHIILSTFLFIYQSIYLSI